LGAAVFAWSFGYILGEVRAGNDPGLRHAAGQAVVTPEPQTQAPGAPRGGSQLLPDNSGAAPGGEDQPLPPVTTRQS
jgi:hypothetical protein